MTIHRRTEGHLQTRKKKLLEILGWLDSTLAAGAYSCTNARRILTAYRFSGNGNER